MDRCLHAERAHGRWLDLRMVAWGKKKCRAPAKAMGGCLPARRGARARAKAMDGGCLGKRIA